MLLSNLTQQNNHLKSQLLGTKNGGSKKRLSTENNKFQSPSKAPKNNKFTPQN